MAKPPATRTPNRPGDRTAAQNGERRLEQRTEIFSGPLPPPAILRQYDEIQPGFAERLLRLTEDEANHRRQVTARAQRYELFETTLGQVFGLLVALAALGATVWLGVLGLETAASIVGGTTIVGLVGAFIAGRQRSDK